MKLKGAAEAKFAFVTDTTEQIKQMRASLESSNKEVYRLYGVLQHPPNCSATFMEKLNQTNLLSCVFV